MEYRNIFKFNDKNDDSYNQFDLQDYDYLIKKYEEFKPSFEVDFYFRVFLKKLLFEININLINEFLDYQLTSSKYPDEFIQILENEVLPSINKIIENSYTDFLDKYYDEIDLEDDFKVSEGIIKNLNFDFRLYYHQAAIFKLKSNFEKIVSIIQEYINDFKNDNENIDSFDKLSFKWNAEASQLAVIFLELINTDYITAESYRGEINKKKLAESLLRAFGIEDKFKVKSLQYYLDENSSKYKGAREKFSKNDFNIPPKKHTT